jgi:hypothetical protein
MTYLMQFRQLSNYDEFKLGQMSGYESSDSITQLLGQSSSVGVS